MGYTPLPLLVTQRPENVLGLPGHRVAWANLGEARGPGWALVSGGEGPSICTRPLWASACSPGLARLLRGEADFPHS